MAEHSSHASHAAGQSHAPAASANPHEQHHPYRRFAAMLAVSFVAMYFLMYAMVDRLDHVYASWNQVYMAGVMTAAMLVVELVLMGPMYPNRRFNLGLLAVGLVVGIGCWLGIRTQAAIGDEQFLRSMIPHHSGAILMCQQADIKDSEIATLCRDIVQGQQVEIEQMQLLLDR